MAKALHYELSEGSSNKFWEIQLSDTSFTTTYGRIGTAGQSTTTAFASAAAAKKQHDKLVAEKTKKGYALVKAASATKTNGAAAKATATPTKTNANANAKTRAKATEKATSAATGSGKPGARYFELVDGSSSKFWEVFVEATSCITRYGRIGTGGQQTSKKLDSKGAAAKEMAKLVAEKTKKGYVEKSAGGASAASDGFKRDARNPALEQAIIADPSDRDAYAVYADWLQEQGDPRGELISLQLAYKDKQAKKLIEKHEDYFLGPLAEHQAVYDSGDSNSSSELRTPAQEKEWQKTQGQAFLWRNGFIHRVRLSYNEYLDDEGFDGSLAEVLKQVLEHPSARFAAEFAFMSNGDPNEDDLQDLIDLLGKHAPPTTRKIVLGDNIDQISWHHTGDLGKLWKGVPNLRVLEIETGEFDVGKMVAPALERAIFVTGGLSKKCAKNIAGAVMPQIKHLEVYFGDPEYGGNCTVKDVAPLLARSDLKNLGYLGLKNAGFADELADALAGAKILKTVKTLDLSLGTLSDVGARALASAKKSLTHLECLDLSSSYLSKEGIELVSGICPKVITAGQQKPDDDDGVSYRYVSISE